MALGLNSNYSVGVGLGESSRSKGWTLLAASPLSRLCGWVCWYNPGRGATPCVLQRDRLGSWQVQFGFWRMGRRDLC